MCGKLNGVEWLGGGLARAVEYRWGTWVNDEFMVSVYLDGSVVENGCALRIADFPNGEEGAGCQLRHDVSNSGGRRQRWEW